MIGIVILNYETWDATLRCIKSIEKTEKEPYGLTGRENGNHHKIYNIYVKNNVFFYVSRETLCGMIKIKVL